MDFSKAFDLIDHQILYDRLHIYGFTSTAITLLKSYLSNRTQYVDLDGMISETVSLMEVGCPQGSCLGPILYIMYTADLSNLNSPAHRIFFADDTCMLMEGSQKLDFKTQIESTLDELVDWVRANKLCLNESKTVIYTNDNKIKEVRVGDCPVEITDSNKSTKYLGVELNPKLKWDSHIDAVMNKLIKGKGAIYRARNNLPTQSLVLLYNAFFETHVNYASDIWMTDLTKTQQTKLDRIQKATVRTIARTNKFSHTSKTFSKLRILKLEDRLTLTLLKTLMTAYATQTTRLGTKPYKWPVYLPEIMESKFTFSNTTTRAGTKLTIDNNNTKAAKLYHSVFSKYKDVILDLDRKIETRLDNTKTNVLNDYANSRCQVKKCYACQC